jgi:hypothetical protein
MFSRPTDAERERLHDDLLHRAELVRTRGWNDYRAVWSTGEVVGVAALPGANDILGELDETLQSVWARWAFDLSGLTDGQANVDDNYKQTRRWFMETAGAL